jgi:hypothetical protein
MSATQHANRKEALVHVQDRQWNTAGASTPAQGNVLTTAAEFAGRTKPAKAS